MIIGICDWCSKERRIIKVGRYKFDGKIYYISLCQWCRAAATRRRNVRLNEQSEKASGIIDSRENRIEVSENPI